MVILAVIDSDGADARKFRRIHSDADAGRACI